MLLYDIKIKLQECYNSSMRTHCYHKRKNLIGHFLNKALLNDYHNYVSNEADNKIVFPGAQYIMPYNNWLHSIRGIFLL